MEFDVPVPDFSQAALEPGHAVRRHARRFALVQVSARIEATPERVFDAWLDPRIAGKWLFAMASRPMARVAIDPRVQGRFRFVGPDGGERIEHTGVYVEIVRPRRLAFSLSAARELPATRVIAEIAPAEAAGVAEVTVTHGDVPGESAARVEARWTGMLYGLGLMLTARPGRSLSRPGRGAR